MIIPAHLVVICLSFCCPEPRMPPNLVPNAVGKAKKKSPFPRFLQAGICLTPMATAIRPKLETGLKRSANARLVKIAAVAPKIFSRRINRNLNKTDRLFSRATQNLSDQRSPCHAFLGTAGAVVGYLWKSAFLRLFIVPVNSAGNGAGRAAD